MKILAYILIALLLGFAIGYRTRCRLVEDVGWSTFNSNKWKPIEQVIDSDNNRKKMVFDLVNNVLKNGIFDTGKRTTIKETIELLGVEKIKEADNGYLMTYEVEEKFGWNIDPEGGTKLFLWFDRDSLFADWRIEEFWHEP